MTTGETTATGESTLDFRPAPGAAPAGRQILSHARTEAMLLVRNGEQLLLALVIPIGLLIAGKIIGGQFGDLAQLTPSVMALAIWSSAFTSVAIATGFERRYGVLERLAATPLGRRGLLAGKALSVAAIVLGQLVILAGVGIALGWRPAIAPIPFVLIIIDVVIATACFCCLALFLAGRLRAEATLALANLIYLIFVAAGSLILPLSRYPEAAQGVLRLLPTAALGEALRQGSAGQTIWWPLPVLIAWLVVAASAAWKGFRWTS